MVRSQVPSDKPRSGAAAAREDDAQQTAPVRWRHPLLFRLLAIGLGLLPLLLIESGLAFLGWGAPEELDDPFVGFHETRPLFVRQGDRYVTAKSRLEFFRPESFGVEKGADEFRIFCLGGSTVQGRPFAIETSFTSFLELSLREAEPGRHWEVVNCGGVSYATYRLVLVLREILKYQPDLIILYTGHNEFLEDRSYEGLRETPDWLVTAHDWLSHWRTYCVARTAYQTAGGRSPRPVTRLKGEVDARLDYRDGLKEYVRDDAWRKSVIQHFEFNVHRMLTLAERQGIPVLLCNPISNLKDTPPFKYEQRSDLGEAERTQFADLWQAAQGDGAGLQRRVKLLRQALQIDDRHAAVHYQLGKCLEALGRYDEAYEAFMRAKDEDVCPLRILEPMHAILRQAAEKRKIPWIDIRELIESRSAHGIPGSDWMVDHVHPSIRGHQAIARRLFQELRERGLVTVPADFESRRSEAFRSHMKALPPEYFSQGHRRLEGLKRWTQGRAYKVKP